MSDTNPDEFALQGGTIELGALLKATSVCESGGDAKHLVKSGQVRVNGQVELRRGHTLRAGDVVTARGRTVRII